MTAASVTGEAGGGDAGHGGPVTPIVPLRPTRRYTARFVAIYGGLAAVLVAAVVTLVIGISGTGGLGGTASGPWSSWKPSGGTTANVTSQIAQHVAQEYHLNKKGAELVAVVSGPPQLTDGTHKVLVSHIAVRATPNSTKDVQLFSSGSTWTDQFCGLGNACSIASGQATTTRGQLVRREALEVALYTFKFEPSIDSVVAFMPPPPGQTTAPLLYLQRSNLSTELSQPLSKTLPLKTPPLPTSTDPREKATIDRLTLPAVYSYTYQGLQDSSALLILDPIAP